MRIRAQLCVLLLLIFSIAQCSGEKSLSSEVKFKSRTDEPIVIKGDLTIGAGASKIVIKAPWFIWNYSFLNNTALRVVVPTAIFKISTSRNGQKVKKEFIIDPGQFCGTGASRSYLAVVRPAEDPGTADFFSGLRDCGLYTVDANLMSPAGGEYENWYIYDLPASDTGVYSAEVEVVGWFEDINTLEITERFNAFDYLITR